MCLVASYPRPSQSVLICPRSVERAWWVRWSSPKWYDKLQPKQCVHQKLALFTLVIFFSMTRLHKFWLEALFEYAMLGNCSLRSLRSWTRLEWSSCSSNSQHCCTFLITITMLCSCNSAPYDMVRRMLWITWLNTHALFTATIKSQLRLFRFQRFKVAMPV